MQGPKVFLIHDRFHTHCQPLQSWINQETHRPCQTQSWDRFDPGQLDRIRFDLIVPIACRDRHRAEILFRWLRADRSGAAVLAVLDEVAESTVREAAEVADEVLFWPARPDELRARIYRVQGFAASERVAACRSLMAEYCAQQLVGKDPAFLRIVQNLPRLAASELPVLITGETGTGKEVVARAIHHLSPRQDRSFIAVDCPGLPDQLFENELFGHARGAFTDANRDQKGLVGLAESGTLFLDEVNTLSYPAQAKLLRFLQERSYRRLGDERFRQADVRILAASNGSIENLIGSREFRPDLFYRLNVLRVHLPPLRERRADIPLLAAHCLSRNCPKGTKVVAISPSGLRKLENYRWPGNVRELFSVIQRACISCDGARISPAHIQLGTEGLVTPMPEPEHETFAAAKAKSIEEFESRYVNRLLRQCDGNVTKAAEAAGKERRSFGRLVKKYGLIKL